MEKVWRKCVGIEYYSFGPKPSQKINKKKY